MNHPLTILDLARQRQSCRTFRPEPVPRAALERCLEAARLAPSACNSQPWRFTVVDDPATLAALGKGAFAGVHSMCAFAKTAPVLIVVETLPSKAAARIGGWFQHTEYNLIDVGIACTHLLLQAECEGLASCWLGWFNRRAIRQVLGLPWRAKIDNLLCLGLPLDPTVRPKIRKPLDQVRHYHKP